MSDTMLRYWISWFADRDVAYILDALRTAAAAMQKEGEG